MLASQATVSQVSLHPQLLVMLDKEAIRDVLYRYCRGVDRSDHQLMISAFHRGAIANINGVDYVADRLAEDVTSTFRSGGQHFYTNILIEVDGDLAFVETYWISVSLVDGDGGEQTRIRGARAIDRFERRNGEWRIAARKVVDEWSRLDPVKQTVSGTGAVRGEPFPDDPVYRR
jgi:SnoaL-like domain